MCPSGLLQNVGHIFLPGDVIVVPNDSCTADKVVLGPGLKNICDTIHVTAPGRLSSKEPNIYWIECHAKRYVATRGDNVIGVVTSRAGDMYRVDIGASELASISYLAFEGSTKKNRPDVKVGDMLFGRLLLANKHMEAELVCIDSVGRSSGYGVIRDGGYMFKCPLNIVRKMLQPECSLLTTLGAHAPYETAIGMNGRVWVKGRTAGETTVLANCIADAAFVTQGEMKAYVKRHFVQVGM